VREGELTVQDMLNRLVENRPTIFDKQITGAQVWRSDDRGESWTQQNEDYLDGLYSTYGYYFGDIRVSPQDVDTIYLLGVPFIKSTDGGRNWKRASGRGVHADHQALWINPWNHNHIVDGNDGGLDISYDGGETWVNMTYPPVGQFYAICYDMAQPYRVYGGLQDNGVWMGPANRTFENNSWTSIGGGDGMRVQVDTRTNELVILGSQFGSYSAVDRANNQRWRLRPRSHIYEVSNRFNWQSPVVMSPHSPEIVYFGTQRLFRSLDQGRTFTALSEDLTTSREQGDVPFSTIVTISESPKKFGLIYVGTDDGLVHVTRDGGINWTKITRRLPKDRYVSRVVASMHEESVAYIALNGYRNDDLTTYLFRTDDYGRRWNPIKGNLPDEAVNVIREDPRHPEILYVGTDTGCFMSLDTGQSWHALAGELPHVPVHDAAVHPRENDLILGTHGRSVFVLDVAPIQRLLDEVPIKTTEEEAEEEEEEQQQEEEAAAEQEEVPKIRVIEKPIHVYEVADISQQRSWPWENQRERAYWIDPPEPPTIDLLYYSRSAGPTTLTITDEDGNPLRTLEDEAVVGINVVKWDHTLDPELAQKARQSREAKQAERRRGRPDRQPQEEVEQEEEQEEEKVFEEWMTWYIYPGTYSLEVVRGDFTEKVTFKVVESRQGGQGRPRFFNP
ncbi:MAG: hypothetical protein KAT18_07835, partial [Candidatus Latescibacteria bacterium]|nr:hypothetical protein [Candidatus Latescibacterota bacterium]